jgi:hypothetical protein
MTNQTDQKTELTDAERLQKQLVVIEWRLQRALETHQITAVKIDVLSALEEVRRIQTRIGGD